MRPSGVKRMVLKGNHLVLVIECNIAADIEYVRIGRWRKSPFEIFEHKMYIRFYQDRIVSAVDP